MHLSKRLGFNEVHACLAAAALGAALSWLYVHEFEEEKSPSTKAAQQPCFATGPWAALTCGPAKEQTLAPDEIVPPRLAIELARQVDDANDQATRNELASAIEDSKLTFSELRKVADLATQAMLRKESEAEAMHAAQALAAAAKGYNE